MKTTPTPEQCAWLAGLYEGEGTAAFTMRNGCGPYPSLSITSTDLDVIEQIKEWFDGSISGPYQNKTPRADGSPRKPQWTWNLYKCSDIAEIIPLIRPWMKSRRGERLDEILPAAQSRIAGNRYERTEEHRQQMSDAKKRYWEKKKGEVVAKV